MKKIIVGKGKFYVYVLKWDSVAYVGSKTAKNSNHEKLFVDGGYFTSSKYVKKYLIDCGMPNNIKVIRFEKAEDAYTYETRYLKRVDARNNPKFLNKHNNGWHKNVYPLSPDCKSHCVNRMTKDNPMKNKDICAKTQEKRIKTITSFNYWRQRYFVNKYSNYEEIELFVINLINNKNCFPYLIMDKFNFSESTARSIVDGFDKQYKFKYKNGVLRKLPGRIKDRNMSYSKEVPTNDSRS